MCLLQRCNHPTCCTANTCRDAHREEKICSLGSEVVNSWFKGIAMGPEAAREALQADCDTTVAYRSHQVLRHHKGQVCGGWPCVMSSAAARPCCQSEHVGEVQSTTDAIQQRRHCMRQLSAVTHQEMSCMHASCVTEHIMSHVIASLPEGLHIIAMPLSSCYMLSCRAWITC